MSILSLVWLYEMHLKIVSAFVHHSVRRMGFMAKPVGGSGAGPCALPHTSLAHILGLEEESEGAADPDHNAAIRCAKYNYWVTLWRGKLLLLLPFVC